MPDQTIDPIRDLRSLYADLVRRRRTVTIAADYYDGVHNLAFTSEKFLEAFGGMFRSFSDNWCQTVTDSKSERLTVQGFRVTSDAAQTDKTAWDWWQRNELDLTSQLGHVDGIHQGAFYVTVWNGDAGAKAPEITVDSVIGTIVDHHPRFRRRRRKALRTWQDDDGFEHAELFYPDRVFFLRTKSKRHGQIVSPAHVTWIVDPDAPPAVDASGSIPNPLGKVPIVEFRNRPRLWASPVAGWAAHSELTPVIPLQDACNKLVADMLIASEFGAFPQRWLTGYEPAQDPKTGADVEPTFRSGPGKVWWTEQAEASFGQFAATELGAYATVIETVVGHIAKISKTPPHYLNTSADRLSGESLRTSETGLVKRCAQIAMHWGAGWEEVIRLAGLVMSNDEIANADNLETVWSDLEVRSQSELMDAVQKKKDLEVPLPQLWEELGYTPDQVRRFPAQRAATTLSTLAAGSSSGPPVAGVAAEVKAQGDAMAVLIKAGVTRESAARLVGLSGAVLETDDPAPAAPPVPVP
jgi:hypothetical protein